MNASIADDSITPAPERPIFRPKGWRPLMDDRYRMKVAVCERDGLEKGCYWCGKPFASLDDATLEHVKPLADGGPHEISNCALACEDCNLQNVPVSVLKSKEEARQAREARKAANRLANGGDPEDCPAEISARFEAVYRQRRGKLLTFADASFALRKLHAAMGLLPPTKHEKRVFKGHFNRWASLLPNAVHVVKI